ncbi:hypothetical protein EUGRSUZ_A01891 [Eucalyptus grandis]|uniref:Uncharacterized protein n=2 Tax=Eucalyptus grandis TaxID=71139 RepID=A0ACC3M5P4_EUCGR|nr:hypothetical protein EUGRSUZ_A01891 [Eucalyptus grandis]
MPGKIEGTLSSDGAVAAAVPAGGSRCSAFIQGLASVRQTGHVDCELSHLSMHSTWKMCLQLGNSLAVSPSSNMLKQTVHSTEASSWLSLRLNIKKGSEEMTVGSRPVLGGSPPDCTWATLRARTCMAAERRARLRRTYLAYK